MRIVSGEAVQAAADLAFEAAGSSGASDEYLATTDGGVEVGTLFLEGRRWTIGSGTNEIQRQILARRVLGLPK
jgi:alkylation response protein AidB-like acyl-CoA dehydrogenase